MNLYRLTYTIARTNRSKQETRYFEAKDDAAALSVVATIVTEEEAGTVKVADKTLYLVGVEVAIP